MNRGYQIFGLFHPSTSCSAEVHAVLSALHETALQLRSAPVLPVSFCMLFSSQGRHLKEGIHMDLPTNRQRRPHRPAGEAAGILGGGGRPSAERQLPPRADDTERSREGSGLSRRSDPKDGEHSRPLFSQFSREHSTRNVPCRYFRERRCLRGDACPFSHDQTTDSPSSVSRAPPAASPSGAAQSFHVSSPSVNTAHHGRGGLPQSGRFRGKNRAQQSRYGGSSSSSLSTSRPDEANSTVEMGTYRPKKEREMTEEETTASETLPGESIPQNVQAGTREDRQVHIAADTPSASSRRRRERFRQRGSSSSASTSGFSRRGGGRPFVGGWTYRPVQNLKESGETYPARDSSTEVHGVQPNLTGKGVSASASGSDSLSEGSAPPPPPPPGLYTHSDDIQGGGERLLSSISSHENRVPPHRVSSQRDRERQSEDGGTIGASSSSTSSASSSNLRRRGGPFSSNNRPPCLPPGLANPSAAGDALSRWTWRDEYMKLKMLYASSFLLLYGCDYSANSTGGQQSTSQAPTATTTTVNLISGIQSISAVSTFTAKPEEKTTETRQPPGEGHQKEKDTDTCMCPAYGTTLTSKEGPVNASTNQQKQEEKAGNHLNRRAEEKVLSDVEENKNGDVVSVIRFTHIPTDPDFDATLFLPNGLLMEVTVTREYPGAQMLPEKEQKERMTQQLAALSLGPHKEQGQRPKEPTSDFKNDIQRHPSVRTPQMDIPPGENNGSKAKKSVLGASLKICNIELSTFLLETIPKVFDEFLEKNPTVPFVIFKALKFVDRHLSTVFALSRMVEKGAGGTPGQLSAPHLSPDSGSRPHEFSSPNVEKVENEDGEGKEKSEEHAEQQDNDKNREWTDEEQRKLEEGLVWYRRVADPVAKWKLIGTYVRTRTARQCVERFRECRDAILKRAAEAEKRTQLLAPPDSSPQGVDKSDGDEESEKKAGKVEKSFTPSVISDGSIKEDETFTAATSEGKIEGEGAGGVSSNTLQGASLALVGLQLVGTGAIHPAALKLLVSCGRCKSPLDMKLSTPKDGTVLEVAGTSAECSTCHLRMVVRFLPKIAFLGGGGGGGGNAISTNLGRSSGQGGAGGSSVIAIVESTQSTIRDLLPSDYILSCDRCSATMKIREIMSGVVRSSICRHCHSKVSIFYESASIDGRSEVNAEGLASGLAVKNSSLAGKSEKKKKQKDEFQFKLGTPLPDQGTCKHYKKSFRWLRFPCCGKAFPCDVCHDEASPDHEHSWATRMICGFCSKEQPFANKQPCTGCGKAVTKDGGTSHWEGGKGCRDAVRMNRKDTRKYKLLSKQQQQAAPNASSGGGRGTSKKK